VPAIPWGSRRGHGIAVGPRGPSGAQEQLTRKAHSSTELRVRRTNAAMATRVLGGQASALFLLKGKGDLESAWEQNRPTRAFGLRESGEPSRKEGGRSGG